MNHDHDLKNYKQRLKERETDWWGASAILVLVIFVVINFLAY